MPRKQTSIERIKFAMEGPFKEVSFMIPYFPDEGEDNGFFKCEPARMVEVSIDDLQWLLDNQKQAQ